MKQINKDLIYNYDYFKSQLDTYRIDYNNVLYYIRELKYDIHMINFQMKRAYREQDYDRVNYLKKSKNFKKNKINNLYFYIKQLKQNMKISNSLADKLR